MQNILLASTLHDPAGSLLDYIDKATRIVLENYKGWVVGLTDSTDKAVEEKLKSLGVKVYREDKTNPIYTIDSTEDPFGAENNHINTLTQAINAVEKSGATKIQYTDGDRIIMAANFFPQDLKDMAEKADSLVEDKKSYLNLRRSAKDYLTHNPALIQTEFEFNRLYSEVFGQTLDIGSTSHVMSIDVVREVLKRSKDFGAVAFPHPKWLLIAKEMGATISSIETEGVLSFETPLQRKEEVAQNSSKDLEDYSTLQKEYMSTLGMHDPKGGFTSGTEWGLRFNTQRQYLTLLRNHLDIFGFDENKKRDFEERIDASINGAKLREGVIKEALGLDHLAGPGEMGRIVDNVIAANGGKEKSNY